MRTIAIMNNKGGVGKTVTAITLAGILTRDHRKNVVLVDCDGQMNLTRFYLPEFRGDDGVTIYDILTGQGEPVIKDNLTPIPGNPHLELLPAVSGLYTLDVNAIMYGSGEMSARRLIDFRDAAEEDNYTDFMIFDCPPGFTASSCAAISACHEVVIPMLVDGFSLTGMADMTAQLASMHRKNSDLRIAGVLINQWHRCALVEKGEALLRSLTVPVFQQVIRKSGKMPETTIERKSIIQYSPRSAAAIDYRAWVRELLGEEV